MNIRTGTRNVESLPKEDHLSFQRQSLFNIMFHTGKLS